MFSMDLAGAIRVAPQLLAVLAVLVILAAGKRS